MLTSRSAVLCYKTCPYKRFLAYHLGGSGFVNDKESLDLLIGTCCHRGVQHLLEKCRAENSAGLVPDVWIDEAVNKAYEVWRNTLTNRSLWLHTSEEDRLDWIVAEQECLFEGLIRAYAIRRLPYLLEEYEILEVEKEEVFDSFSSLVTFLGKADATFRRRDNNKIVIYSLKTTSEYAEVTTRDILHDMQGVSEWVLVKDRLSKIWNEIKDFILLDSAAIAFLFKEDLIGKWDTNENLFAFLLNLKEEPEIYAVQYDYLIKGKRRQDPYGSGIYKQQSFLVHPYSQGVVQKIFLGAGGQIGSNPAEYKWKVGQGKQPKGWNKIDIWDDVGIKYWVEMLATGQIQPEEGHPFDNIIVTPDLVLRKPEELQEWLISTRYQEETIAKNLASLNNLANMEDIDPEDIDEVESRNEILQMKIWQFFPKNTMSCHDYYGKDCQYVFHCHEANDLQTAMDAGMLIPRIPHHKLEEETMIEKGLISNGDETSQD